MLHWPGEAHTTGCFPVTHLQVRFPAGVLGSICAAPTLQVYLTLPLQTRCTSAALLPVCFKGGQINLHLRCTAAGTLTRGARW